MTFSVYLYVVVKTGNRKKPIIEKLLIDLMFSNHNKGLMKQSFLWPVFFMTSVYKSWQAHNKCTIKAKMTKRKIAIYPSIAKIPPGIEESNSTEDYFNVFIIVALIKFSKGRVASNTTAVFNILQFLMRNSRGQNSWNYKTHWFDRKSVGLQWFYWFLIHKFCTRWG